MSRSMPISSLRSLFCQGKDSVHVEAIWVRLNSPDGPVPLLLTFCHACMFDALQSASVASFEGTSQEDLQAQYTLCVHARAAVRIAPGFDCPVAALPTTIPTGKFQVCRCFLWLSRSLLMRTSIAPTCCHRRTVLWCISAVVSMLSHVATLRIHHHQ